jgi:plastocyanin
VEGADVMLVDFAFDPGTFEAQEGQAVVFGNASTSQHEVEIDGESSGLLDAGDSWTWDAGEPGEYNFICVLHPNLMTGTIQVS